MRSVLAWLFVVSLALRTLRSIVILESIGGDEARAVLGTLADGAPGARITEAAQAALKRLGLAA